MNLLHSGLKKYFNWYERWHNHPRHQHAHWFGLFAFLLLTASLISAQLIHLYSEKMEAQAQTALPAPNHPIMFGYYFGVGQFGNFLSEISSYNDTQVIIANSWIRGGAECDTAALDSAFSSTISAGQKIIYGPMLPGNLMCNNGVSAYDTAMGVARNYWGNIEMIALVDEPDWDKATTETNITAWENAVTQDGLPTKNVMINYKPEQIMTGDSFLANNLDIVSFEAYIEPARQNEANLATNLLNEINQAKGRIGNKQMMLVIQGYGRNYCPAGSTTLCWSNLESLKSIQTTGYMAAFNDPRVIGLTIFSYGRLSGTKDLVDNRGGQCIKTEHQRIWGAISGGTQPATIACGGTTTTPNPTPGLAATDATPGWEGGLAYNPVNNNWLVVSSPRDTNIYGRIMSDNAQPVTSVFRVNVNAATNTQVLAPKVAYDTDLNRYLVIWVDFSNAEGIILGQFISPTGDLIGNNFVIPRDFTGGVFLGSNSPMRYDSTNKRFVYVWETRNPNIHTKLRTINGDGTANPTINVTDEEGPGVFQVAPVVDINPVANEYCVVYGYRSQNDPFSTEQRSNAAIRSVDMTSGSLGPVTTIDLEAWGAPSIVYNSVDNNYLITFDNNNQRKGAIFSTCSASSAGTALTLGNFGATVSAYNPKSNTYAVIGQDSVSFSDILVILDGTGNIISSEPIFPEDPGCTGACGNFAPSIAGNYINGTYAATSAHKFATTRFISPIGQFISTTTTPVPTPPPCDPGVVQPGVPVICGFSPTIAKPGDTVTIKGGNLGTTVQLTSTPDGSSFTLIGAVDSTNETVTFSVPSDIIPEKNYTVTVLGTSLNTRTTASQLLLVTLDTSVGPNATDDPFNPGPDVVIPESETTFGALIGGALTYAVYALGIAVFVMFLYSGFLWITSAANPGNIAVAKRYMTNAVIGAVLLLSSYIILYTINPDLVGGDLQLPGIFQGTGTSSVSVITQPSCDNGVCSNNTSKTCTQNTNCNVVCINNVCNNSVIGACTLDTDCQIIPRYLTDSEADAASAFTAGCSQLSGVGYQDFAAIECPGTTSLTLDPILKLQDTTANQQVEATIVQAGGNNGAGRKIVVLDTGYNYNHPDLSSSYLTGKDFVNNDNDPMDDHSAGTGTPGHGSHVAGIITADGIDSKAKGVAPEVKIIAGKVLDGKGQGQFSTIVTAIYWAINGPDGVFGTSDDFKADAINLSVGAGAYSNICDNNDTTSRDMAKAIQYARDHGTLVVVAAGNNPNGVAMPGCVDGAFTVSAVDSTDKITGFSGRGAGVDIAAPGSNIYSTLLGSNYGNKSGTSMASPMVAGIVALIKSAFPNYTVDQVEKAMTSTAIDLGNPGKDSLFGWGRISASSSGTTPTCTGACGTLVASPASCTKGVTASNPNCNINLSYTSSGVNPSSLIIKKDIVTLQALSTASGTIADSSTAAGAYVYSLQDTAGGTVLSKTTVYIYYKGSFTSPWIACTKNTDPANPNCDINFNYTLNGTVTGSATIYKDNANWKTIPLPTGTVNDPNPAVGTHTYTIRDSKGQTQIDRIVVRIEGTAKSRVISSLSSYTVRPGDTITVTGTNLGNSLEVARKYFTVQVHDKHRVRHTSIGTLDPSNTSGTWVVSLPPGMGPGNYTLRVGPTLRTSDVSNEIRLTIN